MFDVGRRPVKLSPRDAAALRKLGKYVDTADVEGVDDGLLSIEHAEHLRSLGWLVLDEDIDWS